MGHRILIGTAGWGILSRHAGRFPAGGTHLERYAARLACAEINSSFYKPHRAQTYERWAASVPDGFLFSVKLPKVITHEKRLENCEEDIAAFAAQAGHLGAKLGAILVQTPPNLAFSQDTAEAFLLSLRSAMRVPIAIEPRHSSWFDDSAVALLEGLDVARVAADPARVTQAAVPAGSKDIAYFRYHGSPKVYYSDYPQKALDAIRRALDDTRARGVQQIWCIFDNTAGGHALANALDLAESIPSPAVAD